MKKERSDDILLGYFPERIATVIRGLNHERNFPVPYVVASILYATSVAIGSTIRLEFPLFDEIYANVVIALVGSRGSNKSAPMREILRPLENINKESIQKYNEQIAKYEALLPEEKEPKKKPVANRIFASDATTESLCQLLEENPRGIGLYMDELMSWIGGFDRYRKHSSGVDESFFLSVYNCTPITKDRTGNSRIINISKPYLSIIGSIQPEVLYRAITKNRIENGLFDRILLAKYEEDDYIPWVEKVKQNSSVSELWKEILEKIYLKSLEYLKADETKIVKCKDDAITWIVTWRNDTEEDNVRKSTEDVRALFKKTQVYCLRIVLLINMLRFACNEIKNPLEVDRKTAISATNIADWFFENSVEFLDTKQKLQYKQSQLDFVKNLGERFTTADAVNLGKNFGMGERTVKKFLKEQKGILFERPSHGNYIKK